MAIPAAEVTVVVTIVPFANVPDAPVDGAANVTVWLGTGLPYRSSTCAMSKLEKAEPALADCGEPE